jgi:hypothetical protein
VLSFGLFLFVSGLAPAGASSANISHSYHANGSIPNGSIVSLDPATADYVVAASTESGSRLLGVAVASDDSLLAVDASDSLTQVATSGNASVLVSTLNGPIKVGDHIAVSPFKGVGMKSLPGAHVVGLAQTTFDGTADATSQQVTDKNGKTSQIEIGFVRISIAIGTDNSAASNDAQKLNGLQQFAKSLTGHVVSTARIIISLIIALVTFVSLAILIYASIYGSIISVGRNPLAKYAVFRTLSSVLAIAALTAAVAGGTIFLLIR